MTAESILYIFKFPKVCILIVAFISYFDLLFALNEQLHPGEKRMLQYAKESCTHLPKDFEKNIQAYFQALYQPGKQEETVKALNTLLVHLRTLVEECE